MVEVAVLRPEEVERLSLLMAGELAPAEAAELQRELDRRPELREAWDRLVSLDLLTSTLSAPQVDIDAAVRRATRPAGVSRRAFALAAGLLALGAGAAWLAWSDEAPGVVREETLVKREVAAFRVTEGSEVRVEGERVYRLVQGTALFDGELTVRVGDETMEVKGRALITTEPSVALLHVTDLVTPTSEEADMIRDVKTQWMTAVLAVMVFSGEVQAQQKVVAGKSVAKQPAAATKTPGLQVTKAWPLAGKPPPPITEVFDFEGLNSAVIVQGSALSKCFEAGLKKDPKLDGKLTALLTISSKGVLEEATVAGDSSMQNPFVASCILGALQQVKFPPAKDVERAQLAYPMEFAARGETGNGSQLILPTTKDCASCTYVNDREEKVAIEVGSSPVMGPADAKVTVVLFSEVECSFCVKAHAVLKQLQSDYAGKVRFVFKHRPMPYHPGARQAAIALHAAHAQGKFWELMDRAYASPVSTEGGAYDAQARSLGLDMQRYRREVESPATAAAIDADLAQAEKLGVKGVPDWFINGQEIVGFRALEEMRKAIDTELAK
jgi:protein-disulfide isomerase